MTKRDKKQSNNPPKDDGPKKTTKPITKKTIKLVSLQPDKRNTKQNTKQTTKHNNNQTINHNHSQPTRRNRPPAGSARGNAKKNGTKKFNYLVEELELPDGKTYLELATSPLDTDELGGGEQTFEFQDPTDADAPLKNKIAIVKDKGPNDDEPVDENYSFNLFTYADASQQSSHKYVFSGSNQSVIPGGHVMSNTFIPLKILDTRLCGDWPGRQQAYTRDWLTFCAYTVALELEKPEQDQRNIHDLLPNELVPKYQDAQELKRKLSQWDGSHLVARDSAGSVPAMAGAKFLYHLLHRDDMKSMSASKVARHIFIRWCLVAHIAASVAKEPFSVKARFWKIPKEAVLNRNLELVYQMVPDLLTWTVKPEILGDKSISKDLINSLKLFANQGHRKKINEKWGKFMAVVFDAVTVPGIKARLALPTDNLQNMVLLGSHPQGYYNTYIGKNDLESLISKGYTWGSSHPFPTNMQPDAIVPFPRGTRLIKPSVYATKPTTISKTNIKIAGNWPRIRTQNAVMDNISANEASHIRTLNISHGRLTQDRSPSRYGIMIH
ncbi:hypothetical protein QC764_0098150 [Podospora pseudoanserina]|uniref:Uncharacterized protein n=1 Tax=Podospora pseudoanserina TaxID=2609844 RepID=A0ABR0HVD3_9PEZI|nr:hypothetical protein QC764_0098150 [Podospora pseudoanserina]